MVTRCDFPRCMEKAPYGFTAYGDIPDEKDSKELFDFDLCLKHYSDLNARILKAVAESKKRSRLGAKP